MQNTPPNHYISYNSLYTFPLHFYNTLDKQTKLFNCSIAMAGPATTPYVTLNSGHNMPVLGLGTFSLYQPPDLVPIFIQAIKLGYRHFDTSPIYGSERPLGFAIAEAIRCGLIQSRDEIFITSKLWCTDADPQLVLPALQSSLS